MSGMTTFESGREFLEDLLKRLRSGEIQLPDFQRGWVWDDDHIKSVLASVARAFPIGAVMMLETGGSTRFQPRPVEGVAFEPGHEPEPRYLILDGQQRLTSLFQATLLGQVVDTRDARGRPLKRWYYIDMVRAVEGGQDFEEAIVGLPEDRQIRNFRGEVVKDYSTAQREYAACLFPLAKVFDSTEWRHGFNDCWNRDPEKTRLFDRFERDVLDVFKRYQVPTITLRRETPKEAVCLVFEKVNTGGVPLDAFELLTATYAAEGFNLRDDWLGNRRRGIEGRRSRLVAYRSLEGLKATDFLMAVALLHTLDRREADIAGGRRPEDAAPVSCKRATILNLPRGSYERWAGAAECGFQRANRFLFQQKVFAARDLPYLTQVVPLAAILARLDRRWEEDGVRRKLARWYWCGVLGELYGSAVETRFARDLPEVLAWIDGGPEPLTVVEANFRPGRLLTLRTRNSAAYKGIHALLMRDGGLDLRTGVPIDEATYFDESIDIHHIFPRAWCERNGVPEERYNSIVNKTAISSTTNRIIGGGAPSGYVRRLQERAGIDDLRMDDILRSHAIDPDLLRQDDFDAFFVARERALLERIAAAMGKRPAEDRSEPNAGDEIDDTEDLAA